MPLGSTKEFIISTLGDDEGQKFQMKMIRSALSAAILVAAMSGTASAQTCLTTDEAAAETVRRLQTTLMVGALQCRAYKDLNVTAKYNQVVQRYGSSISAHDQILTRYFKRTHGNGFRRAMDSYATMMANEASQSARKVTGFCQSVSAIGDQLLKSPQDILAIAERNRLTSTSLQACVPTTAVASTADEAQ